MAEKINISKQLEQSATAGSIIVTDGSNNPKYLPPGSESEVLTVTGGVPTWETASGGGGETLAQTLILGNITGNNDIVLSNNGGVLTRKITEDTGNSYVNFDGNTGTSKNINIIVPTGKSVIISDGTYSFGSNVGGAPFYFSGYTWFNTAVKIAGGGLDLTGPLDLQTGGVTQLTAVTNQLKGKLILGASGVTQGEVEMYNNTDGTFVLIKSSSKKLKINNTADDVAVGLNMDPVAGVDLSIAGIVNLAANDKFKINNTQVFEEVAETVYAGTIAWDGAFAPSGTTNHTYRWSRVGKVVTLRIHLKYNTGGTTNSNVTMTLPSGCPTPQDPSGFSSASDIAYPGTGSLGTGPGNASGGNTKAYLGPNATATGYLITINTASTVSAKVARFQVDYFIA